MYKEEIVLLKEKEEVVEEKVEKTDDIEIERQETKPEKAKSVKKNLFSSQAFDNKKKSSSIVEKPNYDFIEALPEEAESKIFKIEREKKDKSKANGRKLRMIVFASLMAIFTIWGVVNVARIDVMQQSLNVLSNEYYNINLPNYLKNLAQLDAVNESNMDNLFETIPEESVPPATIEKKSNWFDRVCEFLVGLFGG